LIRRRHGGRGNANGPRAPRQFEPCIPTRGKKVPTGPDWIHEIKHDGYRLIVQREGKRVRLFTGTATETASKVVIKRATMCVGREMRRRYQLTE
jgi:ATP-dependent DNA ligase